MNDAERIAVAQRQNADLYRQWAALAPAGSRERAEWLRLAEAAEKTARLAALQEDKQ